MIKYAVYATLFLVPMQAQTDEDRKSATRETVERVVKDVLNDTDTPPRKAKEDPKKNVREALDERTDAQNGKAAATAIGTAVGCIAVALAPPPADLASIPCAITAGQVGAYSIRENNANNRLDRAREGFGRRHSEGQLNPDGTFKKGKEKE